MMRKQSGMISVCNKKLITFGSSTLTSAPITPSDVSRRYSNGRVFVAVLRNFQTQGRQRRNEATRPLYAPDTDTEAYVP